MALAVPLNYVSKTPLSGSMTFLSTSLAVLGVDPTPFAFNTSVGTNTIHMFTVAPPQPVIDDSADLLRKIRKLKKKAKKLKKKGKKAKAKKLSKKVKELQQMLDALE